MSASQVDRAELTTRSGGWTEAKTITWRLFRQGYGFRAKHYSILGGLRIVRRYSMQGEGRA